VGHLDHDSRERGKTKGSEKGDAKVAKEAAVILDATHRGTCGAPYWSSPASQPRTRPALASSTIFKGCSWQIPLLAIELLAAIIEPQQAIVPDPRQHRFPGDERNLHPLDHPLPPSREPFDLARGVSCFLVLLQSANMAFAGPVFHALSTDRSSDQSECSRGTE
jgi:hypothetical protein